MGDTSSEPLQRDAWEYAKTDGLPKEAAVFIRKLCLRIGELRSERQIAKKTPHPSQPEGEAEV